MIELTDDQIRFLDRRPAIVVQSGRYSSVVDTLMEIPRHPSARQSVS
jgi:hypothetical protein